MSPRKGGEGIVWACIARDGTVLVESCPRSEELPWNAAQEAIRALVAKEPTLGWDVSSSLSSTTSTAAVAAPSSDRDGGNQQNVCGNVVNATDDHGDQQQHESSASQDPEPTFKGLRFPVYEVKEGRADQIRIWTFSCAYDANGKVTKRKAQAFLEKVVMITEYFRESPEWRTGTDHSCQDGFGQILQQRMEEMSDPQHVAVIDDALDLSAQIVKLNRAVLNAARLHETSRCLDESTSSSHSSSTASTLMSSTSSFFKQESWNPALSFASRSSFFKLRGTDAPTTQPLPPKPEPEQSTDGLPHRVGTAAATVPGQQRSSLRFVARSVAQREFAHRSALSSSSSGLHQLSDHSSSSVEQRNERPTLHRSRTDSMEDFLQALEREACMPHQPPPAPAKASAAAESDVASKPQNETEGGSDKAPAATSNEKSPTRSRRRAAGGGGATPGSSAAARAETLAILVVMMLSCLLATLPQSVLKATVLNVPGHSTTVALDEY